MANSGHSVNYENYGTMKSSSDSSKSMVPRPAKGSSPFSLYCKQLNALLWKSLITRRVHYISTFFEIIGPLLLPLFAALLFSSVNSSMSNESQQSSNSKPKAPEFLGPIIYPTAQMQVNFDYTDFAQSKFQVVYAPKNQITDRLVASLARSNVELIALSNEDKIWEWMLKRMINVTANQVPFLPILGVSFGEIALADGHISYSLLVPSNNDFNTMTGQKYPVKFNQAPAVETFLSYYRFGQVSSYINREVIRESCQMYPGASCAGAMKRIEVFRMPYPRYQNPENENSFSIFDWVGLLTVLSYVLVCPLIVKRITDEKDSKVKELLRMIGMSDLVFWSSHFVSFFVIVIVQASAFIYIFFGMKESIVQHSSLSLFFVVLLLYGIQLIMFSMLITTIFNRPVLAVVVTSIIWILSSTIIFRFLVPSVAVGNIAQSNPIRLATSLIPTGSLIWFFSIMGDLENKDAGIHWGSINTDHSIYGNFTVLTVVLAMVISDFLYAFLIFYLDNVWPFQHGVPKSPFFLFEPSYWFPKISKIQEEMPSVDPRVYEPEPDNLNAKIQIQNVCKAFRMKASGKKLAVNHLWLNIYENQLTVLLGHNGAGKSTTMNMVTGMYGATSGSIFVNNYNVFTQTNQARRSIGLCPQENIYFNDLTVGQHLQLFALLKDYPSEVNKEINYVLDLLALKDKKDQLASNLSGGMKRKLALGIAIIGDTETLILDEPTSGMDPEARRVIWDLLISMRRKRTILLTTHYMEEADILADRIAIMNEGKLCCTGSPLFLKCAFGTGYRLRVAKSPRFNSTAFELEVLRKYIPTAQLISEVETEVVYSLEAEKEQLLAVFPALFDDIERNKNNYYVESCGLSYATLEDVFLTVGSDVNLTQMENMNEDSSENGNELLLSKQSDLITGFALFLSQISGLFLKRVHFARRYWPMVILQLAIPAAIIALALFVDNKIRSAGQLNTLRMNVEDIYGEEMNAFYYGDPQYYQDYSDLNSRKYGTKVSNVPSKSAHSLESINNWCLVQANHSFSDYLHGNLYGLESQSDAFKTWFNNEQYHSLPLSLITMYEALLRSVLPPHQKDFAKISVTSIPVSSQENEQDSSLAIIIISWAITCLIFLPIAFPFLAASYILYPIKEQASKSKLIQLMTGLSPTIFWMTNFIFDLLNHLIATGVLFLVIYFFDSGNGMFGKDDQNSASALFLMILSFGVSTIPLVYALTFQFSSSSSGFIFIVIFYLVFGFIGNIVFSIFHILNNYVGISVLVKWINPLLLIVRIVPIFSLLYGYQKIYLLSVMNGVCRNMKNLDELCKVLSDQNIMLGCCPEKCGNKCYSQENAFNFSPIGAGTELLYLFLSGLFFFVLIVVFETRKSQILRILSMTPFSSTRKRPVADGQSSQVMLLSTDSDVERESTRIEEEVANPTSMSDLLTVYKLGKRFGNFTAVDEISFGVRYDETFGFLGVNGAGKTTTFSMLTGDLLPTSGNAYIKKGQYTLLEDMQQFQRNIGYCPQFDALLGKLSGEETLYLFARLRGVSKQFMKRDIDNLIRMVGLEQHSGKLAETYSGGNRRKLSIAIALIGSPSLIFLDEPSAGVDPAARRKLWQTLGYIKRKLKSSIVLTSHSMEECEALCSRIGILVNGKLRCLGSTQHLRNKYGQGYSVAIRLKREHESDTVYFHEIQQEVSRHIPSAVLKDYHQCLMHYHITDTSETWSNIFSQMNTLNNRFHFEDYFVSDTTLEQIFIMFARHQQDDNTAV